METTAEDIEDQNTRACLRERFLRTMTALVGRKCELRMFENTIVEGTFKGCDVRGDHLLVSNLQTHLGVVPQTLIRTNDVVHFAFKNIEIGSSERDYHGTLFPNLPG